MVEKLASDRIQKTTSRIAFIGLAAATMMIAASIVGAIQLQEASAKSKGQIQQFCYETELRLLCSTSMKDCREAQSSDVFVISRCHHVS